MRSAYAITGTLDVSRSSADCLVSSNAVSERRNPPFIRVEWRQRNFRQVRDLRATRLIRRPSEIPSHRSRRISVRSSVSTSECKVMDLDARFEQIIIKSSDMRLVSVVTSTTRYGGAFCVFQRAGRRLVLYRSHDDFRVENACRPNNLVNCRFRKPPAQTVPASLVKNDLMDTLLKLFPHQRAVVDNSAGENHRSTNVCLRLRSPLYVPLDLPAVMSSSSMTSEEIAREVVEAASTAAFRRLRDHPCGFWLAMPPLR